MTPIRRAAPSPPAEPRDGGAPTSGSRFRDLAKGVGRAVSRYVERWLHPAIEARGTDAVLRAKLWVVLANFAVVAGLLTGLDHLVHGPRSQAALLLGASAFGVGLLLLLRRTGRLDVVGNVSAGLIFLAITGAVTIRGGAGAPAEFAFGIVPMFAVLTAGLRSGVVWTALVFAELLVFAALFAAGHRLPVLVPEASRQITDVMMSFLVTGVLTGFTFAYEWYRSAATAARARAERERTRAERDRERAEQEARLHEASRLAAVGQLAASVGHEVNNPLSFITANTEHALALLDAAGGEPPLAELRESLKDALEGARRVARIVSDLSTYARRPDEPEGPVDLSAAVEAAVKMARHQIRHRARLEVRLDPGLTVQAEEARLTQLVLNLLINSAQAIEPGDAERNLVAVEAVRRGAEVVVTVRDTGAGISAEALPRVTDPLFTTKEIGEGTGLGLSVCKNIAELYGGRIAIESEEGQGTTVVVALPAAEPARIDAVTPPGRPSAAPRGRPRVLAVDDEPVILRALVRTLRECDVDTVTSGREALEILASREYDAVLCDVMMPEMTGVAVLRQLRSLGSSAADRLIFLTGGVFNRAIAEEVEATGAPTVAKPWSRDDLLSAIDAVSAPAPEQLSA